MVMIPKPLLERVILLAVWMFCVLGVEGFSKQSALSKKKQSYCDHHQQQRRRQHQHHYHHWNDAKPVFLHTNSVVSSSSTTTSSSSTTTTTSVVENASFTSSLTSSSLTSTNDGTPFLSYTRLYERIADQILDIVLLDLEATHQNGIAVWTSSVNEDDNNNNKGSSSTTHTKHQIQQQRQQQRRYSQEQQALWIEQLSKIMTVNGRTLWSQARIRSGVLPSGRTVLGTIVDPLGIFLKEETTTTNNNSDSGKRYLYSWNVAPSHQQQPQQPQRPTQEDRTVVLTRQLVELIYRNRCTDDDDDAKDSDESIVVSLHKNSPLRQVADALPYPPSEMTRPQLVTFSRVLSAKIWDRRVELVQSSNRFWKQMVSLQAYRSTKRLAVVSGQRLLQSVPSRTTNNQQQPEQHDPTSDQQQEQHQQQESERLQAARNFLQYYQSDDSQERSTSSVRTTL